MSTNKTEHLNLHLWESEDDFSRPEINENFQALDSESAAIREAMSAGDEAIRTEMNARGMVAAGSYAGNGVGDRDIRLAFTPKALIVKKMSVGTYNNHASYDYSNIAFVTTGRPHLFSETYKAVEIVEGGFRLKDLGGGFNSSGISYFYAAFA